MVPWRDDHRQGDLVPQDRRGEIDLRYVLQDARHQQIAVEAGPVALQGPLVLGRAVDEIEDRQRQATRRGGAQVVYVVASGQAPLDLAAHERSFRRPTRGFGQPSG